MDVPWKPLKLSSLDDNIRLFAKSQFTPGSYTVLITDLCHIWEESLDRKQILRKALELNTSIDPTEDSNQLELLLQKIQNAVHGFEGTSMKLVHRGPGIALQLRLITPLPAPLEDLKWEMHFTPSPDVSMKKYLTLPLIVKAHEQHSQIDDLIGHLRAKDHVIAKFLDKFEGTGFDLSSIFPGIAGTRGSNSTPREQVARQVHGVGAFDVEKWRTTRKQTSSADYSLILSELSSMSAFGDGKMSIEDDWLAQLPTDSEGGRAAVPDMRSFGNTTNATTLKLAREISGTQDEDVFERQATPPHLRNSRPDGDRTSTQSSIGGSATVGDNTEDETTDDDDLDGPPQKTSQIRPNTQSSFVASQPGQKTSQISPRKLGKLGGCTIKTPTSPGSNAVPSQPIERPKFATVPQKDILDSQTESEPDVHQQKPSKAAKDEHRVVEDSPEPPLKRGKLGKLGGRKSATSRGSPAPRPNVTSNSATRGDRGASIQHGAERDAEQASLASEAVDSVSRDRQGSSPGRKLLTPSVDVPQESEEQKANRKREELKRALESKSQPAKKKRRF